MEIPAGQLGQPHPIRRRLSRSLCAWWAGSPILPVRQHYLKNSPNGLVQLKDVGHAEVGAEDYSTAGVQRVHPADRLSACSSSPTPTRWTWTGVRKAVLVELSKSFPPGLEYAIAFDSTTMSATPSAK